MAGYLPKPPHIAGINNAHPLSQGVIGAWPMTEGSDQADIKDVSGRNQTGAQTGNPPWVGSPWGWCASLDGSTDYYNLGQSPFYKASAIDVSIGFIAEIDTSDFNSTVKLILDTGTGNPDANLGMWVGLEDRGGGSVVINGLQWQFETQSTATAKVVTNNNVFTTTPTWYKILLTYRSADNTVNMYIDGVDEYSGGYDLPNGAYRPRNANMYFGAENDGALKTKAKLQNLILWDRYINPSEAKQWNQDPFCIYRRPSHISEWIAGTFAAVAASRIGALFSSRNLNSSTQQRGS